MKRIKRRCLEIWRSKWRVRRVYGCHGFDSLLTEAKEAFKKGQLDKFFDQLDKVE